MSFMCLQQIGSVYLIQLVPLLNPSPKFINLFLTRDRCWRTIMRIWIMYCLKVLPQNRKAIAMCYNVIHFMYPPLFQIIFFCSGLFSSLHCLK
ncbi:hypothetical protein BDR26DRAFT_326339 [Obelidium mucronatum]|nr:hypothetical protein BDR26DRAFT_326339 [Obelidium mucronatum]